MHSSRLRGHTLLAALAILALGAIDSPAQLGTGSIHGVVTDPSGSAVPGAAITLADSNNLTHSSASNALGQYSFAGLAAGAYSVHIAAPGFAPWEAAGIDLSAGAAQALDVQLSLQAQADQVTVAETDAPKVDTDPSSNADALNLEKNDMEALPDDPDDLTNDLQALAGPAAGPNGGQFFIDGFTGGRMPPKQSIREIRINQNPFAAQFDHPGQGRIEILTKPGSDAFHGEAFYQFSNQSMNSRNPFLADKPPYKRSQWEGDLSGALGSKTSFFADFERRDINEDAFINAQTLDSNLNIVPFTQAIVTPIIGTEANLKIDRQLNASHTLTLRYGHARDENDNQGVGGFSLAGRAYNVLNTEDTLQAVETAIVNTQTVTETRFRFRRQNTDQSGGTTAPTVSVLDAFSSGGTPVGASFDHQNRYELQNYTTRVAGAHSIRWGGLVRGVTLTDQSMQNYAGTFTFTSLNSYRQTLLGMQQGLTPDEIRAAGGGASQFSLAAGNPLAGLNQFDFGLYVQDDWKIRPTLTLSGGLRYEWQTHSHDWSDLGPRIGFAWAVGRDAKTSPKNVIRGGVGVFYDRLSETLTLAALRQNGIRQQQFLISQPDFYPSVPAVAALSAAAQPQTIRETDANWRAPQLIQTAIGYERQLPKHVTVSANYIHSTGVHVLRSRNINAPLPVSGIYPYGGVNAIYLYESSAVYRQNQLITNVTARVNSRFSIFGYYVYGSVNGNADGAQSFPDNQYDTSLDYGRTSWDIRHRFQLNGSISGKWGLRVSPFVTITSGRPFNITSGQDLNGDGLFTDRPAFASSASRPGALLTPYGLLDPLPVAGETIIPRNLGSGPALIAANLRVSKAFNLPRNSGKSDANPRQLIFSVNARNFVNHPNLAAPDGNMTSPVFLQSTGLVSAGGGGVTGNRRIDLQVRFDF